MGILRKAFQKNFERRSANWSPEKREKRLNLRHKSFRAIEIATSLGNVATGGKIKAVLDMTPADIDVLVANPELPEFDQSMGDLLKQPIMRKAMELGQEFIDLVEDELGDMIPDRLEKRILKRAIDSLGDIYDDMAEQAEDKLTDLAGDAWNWFTDLFDGD